MVSWVDTHLVREFLSHLNGNIFMKMNDTGVGGGGANQPGANLRANQTNGPINSADPNGQNGQYSPVTNQPLLGNVARSLDRQAVLGLSSLSRFVFSPNQEQLILTFLFHHHPGVYNNIMQGQAGNANQPPWWRQGNTRTFRDFLLNAA